MLKNKALKKEILIGGRSLSIETGRIARQAGGAVLVRYGDTVVLVTVTCAPEISEGIDFFPLIVDYEEKLYAVGRIPGGFIKREGRPSEKAILSARLIDRSIRPLFPKEMKNEVQVVANVISVDQDNVPEITAFIGASAALTISEIPFQGPIGGVIVGQVDGGFVINPPLNLSEKSNLHLVVGGTKEAIMMVEAKAREVTEDVLLEAIAFGHQEVQKIVDFIEDFHREAINLGLARPKMVLAIDEIAPLVIEAVSDSIEVKLKEVIRQCINEKMNKKKREEYLEGVKKESLQLLLETYPEQESALEELIENTEKKVMRNLITEEKVRVDGRALDEIRSISVEVGILPKTHGSGLFTRGQTQILSVVTLGTISEEQILDGLGIEKSKRFIHHYNFPPFSIGETRPLRTPSRREIGHGALVEKALEAVIPDEENFPYTIRLVSEVLESNGSSSMGSICGSSLALMDAGVPVKEPVAGIAMGLIKENEKIYILTDIQGVEDRLGDMDFKVAGTARGITALQMDIKIAGVTPEILGQALTQAQKGRIYILKEMQAVISAPRKELSSYAPRIIHTTVGTDKIREIIGPGGKIIKRIIEETGAKIDIEDDGRVFIAAVNQEAGQHALEIIENLIKEVVIGQVYLGRVTRIADYGCFVEIIPGTRGMPGKEGLVHISQLAQHRVNKVEDVVKEDEQILVKAIGYDNQGRLKLSKKDAMQSQGSYYNKKEGKVLRTRNR